MFQKNRVAISYQLLAVSIILLAYVSFVYAAQEELKIKEPIVVNGDKVEYFQDQKRVLGTGNISIQYKDVTLTCDKVSVYLDTREAIAEGNVKITQKDAYFTGEKINYNFDTKVGTVLKAYVNSEPFYGKAEEIDKVNESQINLKRGYVTTCDREKPHYRVQARQVRIYLDDRVVAKHVTFFIWNVPVFYFPYYIQPLQEHSAHATVLVGKERDWGYYALVSYRYYFSDICKGRFHVDYRTRKGLAAGIDNYYILPGLGSGSAKFYCTNENDTTAYDPSGGREFKYRAQVRHRWDISDDTVAILEFNKLRDQNFIKDYFYKEFEEEGDPDNYLSIVTTKNDYSTSLLVRKRMDKYFTVVERLPEYTIDIPKYRIGETPFYYDGRASGVFLNKTFEWSPDSTQKDLNTVRFDTYNQLSYIHKFFKFLSTTPYVGTRQTFYSRNGLGDTNVIRGVFTTGVDTFAQFYRVYNVETNALGLDIHKMRHIIMPSANYYYTHRPTISPDNLTQFDELDAIDTANGVKLSLENKLQTKRMDGDRLKTVDLLTLIVSSDYAFRLRKDEVAYKSQKFKSVDFQLEITPYPWLYTLSKMSIDTKRYLIDSASVDMAIYRGEKWVMSAGYRYENSEGNKNNLVTFDTTYKINEKWKARVYERYNINKGLLEEQGYTVYRDLHCWIAEITYDIKNATNDHSFWLVLRLKAFPDVPISFRRTYTRPMPGAAPAGSAAAFQ